MLEKYQEEIKRCLKCKVAMCSKGCPAGTNIPGIMNLLQEERFDEAAELLFVDNPLTAVTSVVCPHKKHCYGNCVLGKKGEPIPFYKIEQKLSRYYLEHLVPMKAEDQGKRVAIVGSGPSGICMAFFLLYAGYKVTIFEAHPDFGGVLRYGIPPFRLPKVYLDLYKRQLMQMGMKFRPNTRIGTNLTLDDLLFDGYDAVFVAVGTGKPNRFGLLGETLGHVHYAVDYLRSPEAVELGDSVVVIGVGNVAMDAARTALRNGSIDVTLLYYRSEEEISANEKELEETLEEGAQLKTLTQVVKIEEDIIRCVEVIKTVDENGKPSFEEDYSKPFTMEADSVILALGQGPGYELHSGYDVTFDRKGFMQANEFGETSMPGVFAAGDIVSGPKTVVEAVAFTRKVADRMIEYLNR